MRFSNHLRPLTKEERLGHRPEGYARLVFDAEYGYWVWAFDGWRIRATDLPWPNEAQYAYDEKPGTPKPDPAFEPYPLQHLAKALGCSHVEVLEIIARHGEFYRKKERSNSGSDA